MAFTQTHLDELDEMIAAGVTRAKFGDKELNFDTFNDLVRRRDYIARQLGKAGGVMQFYPSVSKGLDKE